MDGGTINTIISVCGTVFGTVLGWTLNCIYSSQMNIAKLCFSLQQAADIEETEPEVRTKYSNSNYCIEVYNIGNAPFILAQISLRYGKKVITDCIVTEENKTLLPYEHYRYRLNMQEYDAILWQCKENNLKECEVFAYDISGKKIKSRLDLVLPYIQTHI